ncbi:MAG: hypothetical protein MI866_02565 [Bacteroidales bacterium]|nr:hypothetical protein [Bacteroidales bacterium]
MYRKRKVISLFGLIVYLLGLWLMNINNCQELYHKLYTIASIFVFLTFSFLLIKKGYVLNALELLKVIAAYCILSLVIAIGTLFFDNLSIDLGAIDITSNFLIISLVFLISSGKPRKGART